MPNITSKDIASGVWGPAAARVLRESMRRDKAVSAQLPPTWGKVGGVPFNDHGAMEAICGRRVYVISGRAKGKPRMTRNSIWHDGELQHGDYWDWVHHVESFCPSPPPAERVETLDLLFEFTPPASWSAKKRAAAIGQPCRVKPDWDNLAKAICDALWKQDSALGACAVRRLWSTVDQVTVTITTGSEQ